MFLDFFNFFDMLLFLIFLIKNTMNNLNWLCLFIILSCVFFFFLIFHAIVVFFGDVMLNFNRRIVSYFQHGVWIFVFMLIV